MSDTDSTGVGTGINTWSDAIFQSIQTRRASRFKTKFFTCKIAAKGDFRGENIAGNKSTIEKSEWRATIIRDNNAPFILEGKGAYKGLYCEHAEGQGVYPVQVEPGDRASG